MLYWIVVDGEHQGPYTVEQLAAMRLSADTYAWCEGMSTWTQLRDIPELASIAVEDSSEPSHAENTAAAEPLQKDDKTLEANSVAEEPTMDKTDDTPPPVPEPTGHSNGYWQQWAQRLQQQQAQPAPAAPHAAYEASPQSNPEKCPPSYLVWSIIVTILFFLPLGIVAIVYSSKVSSCWIRGDYPKALKMSERAALWSNIAFTVGLIWIPFYLTISLLAGA